MPSGRAVSSGPAGHLLPQAGEGKWVRPSAGSWVGRGEGDREISHKLPLILSFSRREKGRFVLCREQNMRKKLFDGVLGAYPRPVCARVGRASAGKAPSGP